MCVSRSSTEGRSAAGAGAASLPVVTSSVQESTTTSNTTQRSSTRRRDRTQRSASRTFVQHHYHDHLHDPAPSSSSPYSTESSRRNISSARGGTTVAFPDKLHTMLANAEQDGFDDVVSWQPHGRCFVIHKKEEFVEDIMPKYFQQTKLTSFQRQLNLYGFIRLTARKDRGGYYHEFFLRDRPDLCCYMVRTRVKGNGMKAASSPETEPNFYNMVPCGPKGPQSTQLSELEEDIDEDEALSPGVTFDESEEDFLVKSCDEISKLPLLAKSLDEVSNQTLVQALDLRNPSLSKPRVISPTNSPALPKLMLGTSDFDMAQLLEDAIATPLEPFEQPSTGDVIFFEGLQFRYLDHMDLDNVEKEILTEAV